MCISIWVKRTASVGLVAVLLAALALPVAAQPLTIYEIQSNTSDGDASSYNGQVVDCVGGICVGKYPGFSASSPRRLILQDPNYPNAWGAIQVKDWISPYDMYTDVEIGDWVEMTNMLVEEKRGTTFLYRQTEHNPGFSVTSQGNPLPPPTVVLASDIPAPVYDPGGDTWLVENHDAEQFESMRLAVRHITVSALDLGSKVDNYELEDSQENGCWAADYMNDDLLDGEKYHPLVGLGQHFCVVGGVLEQYTNLGDGYDYYQLVTQASYDLGLCGDLNCDGEVNLFDVDPFVLALTSAGNPNPFDDYYAAWPDCDAMRADVNGDGEVNLFDIDPFVDLLTD